MHSKYYLSVNTTSLAHYIKRAMILPSRFYSNRPDDIQNQFGDYLFLSNIPFVNDSDCSIELILTEDEANNLKKIDNNIMLFDRPLPISRIKYIYFLTDEQKLLTMAKINAGAGFVNEQVVKILDKSSKSTLDIASVDIDNFNYPKELEAKIKDFDQKLGGVAFVRFNTNNKYSKNYFSILSFFNNFIKEEYEKNISAKINTSYHGAFNYKGRWEKLATIVYGSITEEDVTRLAQEDNVTIVKDAADNFNFTKIDSSTITYKIAILNTYGSSNKRKTIDDLVSTFRDNKIPYDKQEGISLIIGINNGYSVFYNQYKEKTVKFKMDSLLDYYTVESIFQYVINSNCNCSKFKYLDKIINKKEEISDIYFDTYTVLDETIVTDNKTVISQIKDNVDSGMYGQGMLDKIRSFIDGILKKKNEIEILLQQKQKENIELNTKVSDFDKRVNELHSSNQFRETQLQEKQIENEELAKQVGNLGEQVEKVNKEKLETSNLLQEKQEENVELNTKVADLNERINELHTDKATKEEEQERKKVELIQQVRNLQEQIEKVNKEKLEASNLLQQKQEENIELNTKVSDLDKRVNKLHSSNQIRETQLQEKQIENGGLAGQVRNLGEQVEKVNKEKLETSNLLQEKQEENVELNTKVADLNERINELHTDKATKEEEQERKKVELIQQVRNLQEQIEKVNKEKLEASNLLQQKQEEQERKKVELIQQVRNLQEQIEKVNKEKFEASNLLQQKQEENVELNTRLENAKDIFLKQKSKIDNSEERATIGAKQNTINLSHMKKAELQKLAIQKNIEVDSKDTVKQLIEKINSNQSSLF